MVESVDVATGILEEFRADGSLTEERSIEANWEDRPTSVTPALLLLFAAKILLQLRRDDGVEFPSQAAVPTARRLEGADLDTVVAGLTGDLSAVQLGGRHQLFSLRNILVVLAALVDDEAMGEDEVKELLQVAEETAGDFLRAEDPFRLTVRGVDVGPWDVSEAGWRGVEVIDLGGLKIPRSPGVDFEINRSASGSLLEVAVKKGRETGLQLQAFHATSSGYWATARESFVSNVRQLGGEAQAWAGRTGLELRCKVPVASGSGGTAMSVIRVLGCDGPTWLLRGIVSGVGAAADSRDEWAYEFFERTVVDPSYQQVPTALLSPAGVVGLRAFTEGQPIPLRRPD
ncbi:DUF3710 domain-containing protein [Kitasatospora sp. NPDC001132]